MMCVLTEKDYCKMSDNSSKTVVQLKEMLKEKGLSTAGVKTDLISRLEEVEKSSGEAQLGTEQADEPQAPQVSQASQEPLEGSKEVNDADELPNENVTELLGNGEETTEIPAEEQPKTLSADEIKNLALKSLEKKATRARKFGDEQGARDAEKEIKRVEKFGLELNSALARELGLAPAEKKTSQSKNKFRSKKKSRR